MFRRLPRSYKVFISHDSKDSAWVEQIEKRLRRENFRAYVFESDPQPGLSVSEKIEDAIESCDVLVVIVTSAGQYSKWVNAEIGYARAKDKPIIAIVDKRIESPVLPFLRDEEYIASDLSNFQNTLPNLVKTLTKRKTVDYLQYLGIFAVVGYLVFRDKK